MIRRYEMIDLLIFLLLFAILSGLGRWATDRRFKRKYQEKYKDCCGTNCCDHENKGKGQ